MLPQCIGACSSSKELARRRTPWRRDGTQSQSRRRPVSSSSRDPGDLQPWRTPRNLTPVGSPGGSVRYQNQAAATRIGTSNDRVTTITHDQPPAAPGSCPRRREPGTGTVLLRRCSIVRSGHAFASRYDWSITAAATCPTAPCLRARSVSHSDSTRLRCAITAVKRLVVGVDRDAFRGRRRQLVDLVEGRALRRTRLSRQRPREPDDDPIRFVLARFGDDPFSVLPGPGSAIA